MPDDSAPEPIEMSIEISGVLTETDLIDGLGIAHETYPALLGETPKRPPWLQFVKGLCIGLGLALFLAIWLTPIVAALAGYPNSATGWGPFIASVGCYLLLVAAQTGRLNRRLYRARLAATRPDLGGAGAPFTLRLSGRRIELRDADTECVWHRPTFTRLIEAPQSFVLLAGLSAIPVPKRGLAAQLAAEFRAWAEQYAAGVVAPGRPRGRWSRGTLRIAAYVILAGGLLPPLLVHANNANRQTTESVVRIALSGHELRLGGETIPLERESYTASLDRGALREWLVGCSYPGDATSGFEIERYRPGIFAPPPADELQDQHKRFPQGVPADAAVSALPNDGVLISWSAPPSGDGRAMQCVFVRRYADPIYHGAASWPIYGRTAALWSCSPSKTLDEQAKWAIAAAPVYDAELDATTQTEPNTPGKM